MHILITGGTGLIGSTLAPRLLHLGHRVTVVTRDTAAARSKLGGQVGLWSGLDRQQHLDGVDAVVNLAGAPIAARRWNEARKRLLCESRWQITERLVTLIKASSRPPELLISGSATGFYGNSGDRVLSEDHPGHDEFTHLLCARWEQLAQQAQSDRTRVCLIRTGVVLSREGGALAQMKLPFKLGIGGPLGSGKQYMPWIHLQDAIAGILWLLDKPDLHGPFNLVAPHAVRNEEFAAALGDALRRPTFIRTPAVAMKLIMGESAVLVLGGQHVIPQRLKALGFAFHWDDVGKALKDVV